MVKKATIERAIVKKLAQDKDRIRVLEHELRAAKFEVLRQKGLNKAISQALKAANRKIIAAREAIAILLKEEAPQWGREDYERAMHGRALSEINRDTDRN